MNRVNATLFTAICLFMAFMILSPADVRQIIAEQQNQTGNQTSMNQTSTGGSPSSQSSDTPSGGGKSAICTPQFCP